MKKILTIIALASLVSCTYNSEDIRSDKGIVTKVESDFKIEEPSKNFYKVTVHYSVIPQGTGSGEFTFYSNNLYHVGDSIIITSK